MMSLWDALRMNMMISYQELVRTFLNELNAGEKAALVHEQVNNAGAEAHQTQARKLRGLYSTRCRRVSA